MGACLGHCFAKVTNPFTFRYFKHTGMFSSEERVELELDQSPNRESHTKPSGRSKTLLSFLSLKRFKKKHRPVSMELAEEGNWRRRSNKYFRLESGTNASTSLDLNVSLQTVDARTLLKHPRYFSSTPASSLDLEWEHEVSPVALEKIDNFNSRTNSPSKTSSPESNQCSLTASPWSRVSTPNSLEWDSVGGEDPCIDIETEQLLTEIERLRDKTLKETGEWTDAR